MDVIYSKKDNENLEYMEIAVIKYDDKMQNYEIKTQELYEGNLSERVFSVVYTYEAHEALNKTDFSDFPAPIAE